MDGRKYQRKSGIKRTLVMLLALVMLASVCFPAMRVNAEGTPDVTVTEGNTESYSVEGLAEGANVTVTVPDNSGLTVTYDNGVFTVNAASAKAGTYTVDYAYQAAEGADQSASFTVTVAEAENDNTLQQPQQQPEQPQQQPEQPQQQSEQPQQQPEQPQQQPEQPQQQPEQPQQQPEQPQQQPEQPQQQPEQPQQQPEQPKDVVPVEGERSEKAKEFDAQIAGIQNSVSGFDGKQETKDALVAQVADLKSSIEANTEIADAEKTELLAAVEPLTETVNGLTVATASEPVISETAKAYLQRIEDLKGQIENLDPDASDYEDQWRRIFDDLIIIQQDAGTDWEENILSDDEFETICYAAEALKNQLGDPYDAATYAYKPDMKYYNKNNNLAYDVAHRDAYGYNDSSHTYVASVTLGDVAVTQADSNQSYGLEYVWGILPDDNRVGSKLSSYYENLDTGDADTYKTLVITPATGYYVTRVVVACCDGGVPYNCGTWADRNAYDQKFAVSAGGALSVQLRSSAFGHAAWNSYESRDGEEQYFILIEVAPVPTPLYIEYTYGAMGDIMGDDLNGSVFANPSQWTAVGGSNEMGRGRIDTQYTQYRYEYNSGRPNEVANWEHYANVVTDEAKAAAAAKGYYFAGWEATYYTKCNNYQFSDPYSDNTTHYDERAKVNLITNVRLVAQWAPIPMKVTKTVTGLPDGDSQPRSYTVQVQKHTADGEWANFGDAVTLQVSGNDTATSNSITSGGAVCPVTPGTYRVVETAGNMDIVIDDATYYVDVTGEEITVVGSPATSYTLNVTNAYSTTSGTLINPDQSYIVVEKVFTGIQKGQIPGDFTITVGGNDKTYTLTNKSDAVNGIQFSESPDGLTWTWKITNAEPGSYVVKESNYGIGDYNHTATPSDVLTQNGANVSVSGSTIGITVTADINSCKNKTFEIDDGKFFAAALTTNSQKCCIVVTEQPLSASAKAAITKLITRKGGNWKTENGIFFYSIAQYKGSVITIMDSDITVSDSGNAITFGDKNNWSTALTAEYDYTAAQAGDIQITNGYTLATTSVTVTKTVSGNMGDQGKEFTFTYKLGEAGNTDTFTLKHGGTKTLENLKIGETLYIKEDTDYVKTVTYTVEDEQGKPKTTTVEVKDGWYQIPVAAGTVVNFNNTKNATIDTGIVTDSIPYILLLTMAVIGAGVLLVNKRRGF